MVLPPLRERGAEDIERLARHFVGDGGEAAPAQAAAADRRRRWSG